MEYTRMYVFLTFRTIISNRTLTELRRVNGADVDWVIRSRKVYGWDLIGFRYEWE